MARLEGGVVGGNVSGRTDFNGAVQSGDPKGTDFPNSDLHRGTAFLALAVDRPFDLAPAQLAGDVNVRAFAKAGREFCNRAEAGDAMPVLRVLCFGFRGSKPRRGGII